MSNDKGFFIKNLGRNVDKFLPSQINDAVQTI